MDKETIHKIATALAHAGHAAIEQRDRCKPWQLFKRGRWLGRAEGVSMGIEALEALVNLTEQTSEVSSPQSVGGDYKRAYAVGFQPPQSG